MFRDDYEAVRARADVLEKELAEERGRSETAEAVRERLEAELAAAQRELERLRPPPPAEAEARARAKSKLMLVIGAMGALVTAGVAMVLVMMAPGEVETPVEGPVSVPAQLPPPVPALPMRTTIPQPASSAPITTATLAAETGRLEVRSEPLGAEVACDGRVVGRTPLEIDLPAGLHILRLRPVDGAADAAVTRQVQVVAGQKTTLSVQLE